MSQAPLVINNVTHAQYRSEDNARAAALASFQAGNAAPANPVAGMFWLDTSTTPASLKQRNVANNAWGPPLLQFATGATADTDTTLPLNKATALALFGTSLPDFAAGGAGQPRIEAGAFPDFAVGAVEVVNFTGAGVAVQRSASSDSNTLRTTSGEIVSYIALKAGTLRLSFEGAVTGTSPLNGSIILKKNGATLATLSPSTGAYAAYTYDFTFAANDLIAIEYLVSSTGAGLSRNLFYRNVRLLGDKRGLFRI